VRKKLITMLCAVTAATCLTLATPAPQQNDAAPGKKAAEKGRGKRKGPPGPVPRLPDGKPDLTGMWNAFGSVGREEKAPNMLPWAEEVVARHIANDSAEDFEARCLPGGPPRPSPYLNEFVSTPKLVVLLFEGNTHMYRQFFVDGSDHPKNLKPTFYGDSRAHWDGDTLVVDTIGLFDKSWIDFSGTPHTPQMHLIETFHRVDLGNLEMQVTIDDPGAFSKPWVMNRSTTLDTKAEMLEYVCNENNQDADHLHAAFKTDKTGVGTRETLRAGGVPPVKAPKRPTPPSGTTPRTQNGKVDLSGVWIPTSTVLPSDPSFQPWAQKIYDQHKANKGKDDPERYCLPDGAVRVNPRPYKIVQRPDLMLQLMEGDTHSYRRFFLDGRAHNLDIEPESWTGQSIGKWEGDALVVDTVGFNDKSWLDSTGKPHSNALHLSERYRRPDLGHLNVDITITDEKALAKPYQFTRTFTLAPGLELQEYVCQAILDGLF
jgi:hypothetical protein